LALLLLIFAGLGGTLVAISFPLRRQTFAPEQIFGSRTPPVLKNRAIWGEVYAAGLRGMAGAGAAMIAGVGFLYLIPGMNMLVYAILGLLVVLICLGGGIYYAWRTMQRFERPTRRSQPSKSKNESVRKSRRHR